MKRTSTAIGVLKNVNLEYLKRLQISEPLHTKIYLFLLILRQTGCMGIFLGTNHNPFCQTGLQKRESQQLFFGGRLVSRIFEEFQHPAIQTKKVQYFDRFFHQIKVRQPIGRKDSIPTVIRTSRRLN